MRLIDFDCICVLKLVVVDYCSDQWRLPWGQSR